MATEYRQRPGTGDHFDDEDLVMSSAQQRRNWRGILIALMVIIAVLAMIVTSVVLLTPPQPEELLDSYSDLGVGDRDGLDYYYNQRAYDETWWRRRGMRALRLSDILTDSASIKVFNGTWISGNEAFFVTGSGGLAVMEVMADATVQTTRHLMSRQMLQKLKGSLISFELSPDRNHVLIGHDAKKLFRYSKTARYTVYTVSTGQMTPVILDETTSADSQPYLLHAQWHNISTEVDKNVEPMALIAVYRYDVFYVPWTHAAPKTDTRTEKKNVTAGYRESSDTVGSKMPPTVGADGGANSTGRSPEPWLHGPVRRITTTGYGTSTSVGAISNGVADYLYETEILKRYPAVWPSSGRYLMYATFDDRRVGEYKYSVYAKDGRPSVAGDDEETESRVRQPKLQKRKRKRRRRRNARSEPTAQAAGDEKPEYYLYPKIRSIKYPKANTPNPIVTLSVIVNLDQLGNPKVQPKIRTLRPPPIFQYTDDYYFTAAQWVNDGGVVGSLEDDDEKSSVSAAEICVVWLNRAQNTSVTTLCKSPMWICHETQVINAVGGGRNGGSGVGGQTSGTFTGDRARRRYRRNGTGSLVSPTEAAHKVPEDDANSNRLDKPQRQHQKQRQRRRRAGGEDGREVTAKGLGHSGWVDASVGGIGGGVPSTGGGIGAAASSAARWWSTVHAGDGAENFAADDGYAGPGGGRLAAALVRRGWESGDKELTPRSPVFAADGQGYVSVAPVRDDAYGDYWAADHRDHGDVGEGGVRLRRPSVREQRAHDRDQPSRGSAGEYFAQLVAVNITKKLLVPLTIGELDAETDDGSGAEDQQRKKIDAAVKSWTVVRILAWDKRSNMIYFLGVPSGRGAPHHRHLYAVKFTSLSNSPTPDSSSRSGNYYQQHYQKTVRGSGRNRLVCLSCDVRLTDNTRGRRRRDFGVKQNRMDEARDDRLRQQQRERWENQKEEEEANNEKEEASAEKVESHQRQNRRRQQKEIQNRGKRYCTYYDAQFSQDGSHYALVCLGPSVPYVTLHKIVTDFSNDDIENIDDGSGGGDSTKDDAQKSPKHNSTYSFEFIALLENNTRLQDKYTNRVLLPGTRTFQLRLSGGRKLTTSGGLHFNDPLAAANYYSNGGGQQLHFSSSKRPDLDPLTIAQVRLYLPLSVYDPEADQRPEFMPSHVNNHDSFTNKVNADTLKVAPDTDHSLLFTHDRHRRRRSSSSRDNENQSANGSKRRRQYKQQRRRRYKKLYPMLVVVNSDPGSQAITDRFSDRLGYTTGLLCSGSFGKTRTGLGSGTLSGGRPNGNKWDLHGEKFHRNRRSATTRYYSSSHLDNENYESNDYEQDDEDTINNEYVVAVIDPGRGTWARGYESLLALNYDVDYDKYRNNSNEEENEPGGHLGTSDIRDQMEAVEYLLSSATTMDGSLKNSDQGYYSDDRSRKGRGSRDGSRWFSSPSQSNRRYFSDDEDDNEDYYNNYNEYNDDNANDYNDDYYFYYYSNGGDSSDYGGDHRESDVHRDEQKGRRDRRSTSNRKMNSEALRLPYVDATRVALLGGGPTSPFTPSSVYGGYAAARMALWQSVYGGAPIEKKNVEVGNNGNRKEPVAIHSSFKCAITMAPVYSWRLYASAFSERYYGYYSGNDEDNWTSYDRSNLIPLTKSLNDTSFSQLSNGKGINLFVVHGTADTAVHPQHSMMLVQEVMQQQQQLYIPNNYGGNLRRRNNTSTKFRRRVASDHPFQAGAIRLSQLVLPDVDLSNSRMVSGIEHSSSIDHQHQLLHSIYGHITQYLEMECFNGVFDASRVRGVRLRGRSLRKRRRRRWRTSNKNQENLDEHRQQHQKSQRSISTSNDDNGGDNFRHGGRYRRHDIDNSNYILENNVKSNITSVKIKEKNNVVNNIINKINNFNWSNRITSNLTNVYRKRGSDVIDSKKLGKYEYSKFKDDKFEGGNSSDTDYNKRENSDKKDKKNYSD